MLSVLKIVNIFPVVIAVLFISIFYHSRKRLQTLAVSQVGLDQFKMFCDINIGLGYFGYCYPS